MPKRSMCHHQVADFEDQIEIRQYGLSVSVVMLKFVPGYCPSLEMTHNMVSRKHGDVGGMAQLGETSRNLQLSSLNFAVC